MKVIAWFECLNPDHQPERINPDDPNSQYARVYTFRVEMEHGGVTAVACPKCRGTNVRQIRPHGPV